MKRILRMVHTCYACETHHMHERCMQNALLCMHSMHVTNRVVGRKLAEIWTRDGRKLAENSPGKLFLCVYLSIQSSCYLLLLPPLAHTHHMHRLASGKPFVVLLLNNKINKTCAMQTIGAKAGGMCCCKCNMHVHTSNTCAKRILCVWAIQAMCFPCVVHM